MRDENFCRTLCDSLGVRLFVLDANVPELAERIYNEIKTIAEENNGRTVLVAFHAAAIRSFFGKILNIPPENLANELWFPINASVSVVYYDGEKLIPGEYSHADHLGDMGTSIKK